MFIDDVIQILGMSNSLLPSLFDKAFRRNISSFVSSDSQDNKCAADNLDKNLLSASWMDSMTGPKTPSNNRYNWVKL